MPKSQKYRRLRYFILAFSITFLIIATVGMFMILTVTAPQQTSAPPASSREDSSVSGSYRPVESDRITVLCMGYAKGAQQPGGFALVFFDAPEFTVKVASLPPELLLDCGGTQRTLLQTLQYGGADYLRDVLSENLNIAIDRQLKIREEDFAKLVDSFGIVRYDVPSAVQFQNENGFIEFAISAGEHLLSGDKFCKLIRYSQLHDEIAHCNRQSELLAALVCELLKKEIKQTPAELFLLGIALVQSDLSILDFDLRVDAIKVFLQSEESKAEAVLIEATETNEGFLLTDIAKQRLLENFTSLQQ